MIAKNLEFKIVLGCPYASEISLVKMIINLTKNYGYFQFWEPVKIKLAENILSIFKHVNVLNTSASKLNRYWFYRNESRVKQPFTIGSKVFLENQFCWSFCKEQCENLSNNFVE